LNALYAYFGLLGSNGVDVPGHVFYQLPLLYTLKKQYNIDSFDFYSYLPVYEKQQYKTYYPFEPNGMDNYIFNLVINNYNISLYEVIQNLKNKKYDIVFLKARFLNESTLRKKWHDELKFKFLFSLSKSLGIKTVVIDTDLSLPSEFYAQNSSDIITINSLNKNMYELSYMLYKNIPMNNDFLYYGNVYANVNKTQSKDKYMIEFFNSAPLTFINSKFIIVGKCEVPFKRVKIINRTNRKLLYQLMKYSKFQINISKKLYIEKKFIPARVFESLLFYKIPISYNFDFIAPQFSFHNLLELSEIVEYINSLSPNDYFQTWKSIVDKVSNN